MVVTQRLKIDFVLINTDRSEIHVIPQLVDETGKEVANDSRVSVKIGDQKVVDQLLALVKPIVEPIVRGAQTQDQPPSPALPAQDAIVIDGVEVRPALAAVPARPATTKNLFADGTVIVW